VMVLFPPLAKFVFHFEMKADSLNAAINF